MDMTANRTILYGDTTVPLLTRDWSRVFERMPYRKTYSLKPGEAWRDAPVSRDQSEHYVWTPDGPIPVGAAIAMELRAEGASTAVFTECFGGCVLMSPDMVCVANEGPISDLLDQLWIANGKRWAGLPDVLAIFSDGRVAMREAKVAGRDKVSQTQHSFARAARELLGERLDLAVIEWGSVTAPLAPV